MFNGLPIAWRFAISRGLVNLAAFLRPGYMRLAQSQLQAAFPDKSPQWCKQNATGLKGTLARGIVDFFRAPYLSEDWIAEHITVSGTEQAKAEAQRLGKPILFIGGHIGSFDLLAHLTGHFFGPLTFVIRNAKSASIDAWWSEMRGIRGNSTIPRSGAIRGMLKALKSRRHVGILFDQNVTSEFAIFVPWFGRLAATTKALAVVALKTESPVVLSTMHYVGGERYKIEYQIMQVQDVYQSSASAEEKVYEITARAAVMLEAQIRKFPEQWFWMHRRWRTRPEPEISLEAEHLSTERKIVAAGRGESLSD